MILKHSIETHQPHLRSGKKKHPKSLETVNAEKVETLMRSSVQVKSGHLLGVTKARKLALGLLLVLGRRGWRLVVLLDIAAGADTGGEAVLLELLPDDELVVDEDRAHEVGEHQPRDEQQLQLIPNRDSEYLFPAIFRLVIYTKTYSNAQ